MGVDCMLYNFDTVSRKSLAQRLHGALGQLALACECGVGTKSRGYRQQETQCGAALATGKLATLAALDGHYVERSVSVFYRCSQGIQGVHRCIEVVVQGVARNLRGSLGEGRADEQTMGLRL